MAAPPTSNEDKALSVNLRPAIPAPSSTRVSKINMAAFFLLTSPHPSFFHPLSSSLLLFVTSFPSRRPDVWPRRSSSSSKALCSWERGEPQSWTMGISSLDWNASLSPLLTIHLHQGIRICLTWDVIMFSLPHTCSFLWPMFSRPPTPSDSLWSIAFTWKNSRPAATPSFCSIYFSLPSDAGSQTIWILSSRTMIKEVHSVKSQPAKCYIL